MNMHEQILLLLDWFPAQRCGRSEGGQRGEETVGGPPDDV